MFHYAQAFNKTLIRDLGNNTLIQSPSSTRSVTSLSALVSPDTSSGNGTWRFDSAK